MPRGGTRPGSGRKPRPVVSMKEARRRKEVALCELREIEVNKRRGESLDAKVVEREWSDVLRMVRAGVLAVVSRVRSRLPHLTAQDARVIDEELRAALRTLGENAKPDDSGEDDET
jgi:phage terminase Nu1 subunit (DNA packaging protein)